RDGALRAAARDGRPARALGGPPQVRRRRAAAARPLRAPRARRRSHGRPAPRKRPAAQGWSRVRRPAAAGFDLVSAEARSQVDAWGEKSRALFNELLEDAPSDMQRELLNRAVAAGHSAAEVHAFADALRGFTDGEAFDRCTI